jgi:HK97 family phage portal protein
MNLFQKVKSYFQNSNDTVSLSDINELFFSDSARQYGADLSEITYFTCLKTLSEALGKMPVYLMGENKERITDHETARFLSVSPNSIYTPIQFFTYMEFCRNHFGNAYAYVERLNGKITGIYPLDPRMVQIWVNNTDTFTKRKYTYYYTDERSGKAFWLDPEDVLHVKSWVTDRSGLAGKSVREILATNMAGSKASQAFLNDLYQKGLTANAVVKYVGDLSREQQRVMLKQIDKQARDEGRRLITLPVGYDIQTLDLKLTDSQFYELKKYNSLQVAAAFGIQPNQLNDYSKSSYANSAAQSLAFYVNTLLYNITLYEQEFNRKLLTTREQVQGLGFKFNVWTILRGDPTQQADVLQKMVASAIYSPNEARSKLDMPPTAGGDVHIVNGSYVKLEDVGLAYIARVSQSAEGGDDNAENQK